MTKVVAGLCIGGMTAPRLIDSAMDREMFTLYAKHFLAPTLREGDIFIHDNLPAHSVADARATIEAVGAKMLYLPPYSNPIEEAFAKIKALLRQAAERTFDTLEAAIPDAPQVFDPHECANYFKNYG